MNRSSATIAVATAARSKTSNSGQPSAIPGRGIDVPRTALRLTAKQKKELTEAESQRMDKESFYRMVEAGDPDAIASSTVGGTGVGADLQSASQLLETSPQCWA